MAFPTVFMSSVYHFPLGYDLVVGMLETTFNATKTVSFLRRGDMGTPWLKDTVYLLPPVVFC